MPVGYARVSTADEHQSTGPQRDALRAAGVDERHVYEDRLRAGATTAPA
jgi:DNA invertase Pin-like site-specific DNA recombinase